MQISPSLNYFVLAGNYMSNKHWYLHLAFLFTFCFLISADNAICFVDQNTGNDTNTLCGTVLYPCMTIQTCINQMQNETGEATVMLQSNITAIPGNYNITLSPSVNFTTFSISSGRRAVWDLENMGFALAVTEINREFTVDLTLIDIYSSSTSALIFISNSSDFHIGLNYINFFQCFAYEGSSVYAKISGSLIFHQVDVSHSSANQCGGISVYGNDFARISIFIGSTLSFFSTESTTFGGCMCLFLSKTATFTSVYSPTNIGMLSIFNCNAGSEGLIYADGGLVTISSPYCTNSHTGSGGFLYGKNLESLHINSGTLNKIETTGNGSAILIQDSNFINMTSLTIQSCSGVGVDSSGTLYLNSINQSYLQHLLFTGNKVTEYGGGIYFKHTNNVTVYDTQFSSNQAKEGSSFGCSDFSVSTEVISVNMTLGRTTTMSTSYDDVWSDGTCGSPFWNTPSTRCPNGTCSNCDGSVCSDSGLTCQCFCSGDPDFPCASQSATITPSLSVTPTLSSSPSGTPSVTPTISVSGTYTHDHHYIAWVLLVVLLLGIIVVAGLGFGIYFRMKTKNNINRMEYHNIN